MLPDKLNRKIEGVILDNTSGSSIIADRVERLFKDIPHKHLTEVLDRILTAHPTMAAVINRINYLCLMREGREVERISSFAAQTFDRFWKEHQGVHNWVTLSMSHWTIECLKFSSLRRNIAMGISHPDREGLISGELLKEYHNVTVYEDNSLPALVEQSDGVILGADLIEEQCIVNKCGSLSLALAAKYFNKPLYVISSGDKHLTGELSVFFRTKEKQDVIPLIHYFDRIPLELVTGIYYTSDRWNFPLSSTMKQLKIRLYGVK